ncbi:MAG: hypothetical protein JWO22_55 [Frankiales bacterium]|nr:hypothetical protein [Frankiales bacterium]
MLPRVLDGVTAALGSLGVLWPQALVAVTVNWYGICQLRSEMVIGDASPVTRRPSGDDSTVKEVASAEALKDTVAVPSVAVADTSIGAVGGGHATADPDRTCVHAARTVMTIQIRHQRPQCPRTVSTDPPTPDASQPSSLDIGETYLDIQERFPKLLTRRSGRSDPGGLEQRTPASLSGPEARNDASRVQAESDTWPQMVFVPGENWKRSAQFTICSRPSSLVEREAT